jgi:hypothetical protein
MKKSSYAVQVLTLIKTDGTHVAASDRFYPFIGGFP